MWQEKELEELLAFCNRTVDKSGKLLLDYQARGFDSELKPDNSVVTDADTAAEELIRKEIEREFPSHKIVGEEFGGVIGKEEFYWTVDPIDGTANYLTGIPTYGTILAVFFKGVPLAGVSDHPALGWRFTSRKGGGVFRAGKRLMVRGLSKDKLVPQDSIGLSSRVAFEYSGEGKLFDEFVKMHPNIRVYRDVFGHGLAASGNLGAMVELNCHVWDVGVARLFMEEAGGVYHEFPARGAAANKRLSAVFGAKGTVDAIKDFFMTPAK